MPAYQTNNQVKGQRERCPPNSHASDNGVDNTKAPPDSRHVTPFNNENEPSVVDEEIALCKRDAKAFSKEFRRQSRKKLRLEEEVLIRIRTDIFEPDENEDPTTVPILPPPTEANRDVVPGMERLQVLRQTALSKLSSYVSALQPTVAISSKSENDLKQLLKSSMQAAEEFSQGLDELNIQLHLHVASLTAIQTPSASMPFVTKVQYMELLMRSIEVLPKLSPQFKSAFELTQYRIARILRLSGRFDEAFVLIYGRTLSTEKQSLYMNAVDFVHSITVDSYSLKTATTEDQRIGPSGFKQFIDRFENPVVPPTAAASLPPAKPTLTPSTTIVKECIIDETANAGAVTTDASHPASNPANPTPTTSTSIVKKYKKSTRKILIGTTTLEDDAQSLGSNTPKTFPVSDLPNPREPTTVQQQQRPLSSSTQGQGTPGIPRNSRKTS